MRRLTGRQPNVSMHGILEEEGGTVVGHDASAQQPPQEVINIQCLPKWPAMVVSIVWCVCGFYGNTQFKLNY